MLDIKRREFITLVGCGGLLLTAKVRHARAQQPAMPVIGFLHPASPDANPDRLRAFRLGLRDAGFVESQNVAIEYRWANNQIDRLPELAEELVGRQVSVIIAISYPAALAAKTATAAIPVVFMAAEDPVKQGLVKSLARPGGNLTGVNFFGAELASKRLELLRELVPEASRIAVLVDPTNRMSTESTLRDVDATSRKIGLQIHRQARAEEVRRPHKPRHQGTRGQLPAGGFDSDRQSQARGRCEAHRGRLVSNARKGQAQHLDPERFRATPRTNQSFRARLRVRQTGCTGWEDHVRHKTSPVHHASRWRGGRVAARSGARAAGDTGDRLSRGC